MAETFNYDRLTVGELYAFLEKTDDDVPIMAIDEDGRELEIGAINHVTTIDNDEYIEIHIKKTAQPIS